MTPADNLSFGLQLVELLGEFSFGLAKFYGRAGCGFAVVGPDLRAVKAERRHSTKSTCRLARCPRRGPTDCRLPRFPDGSRDQFLDHVTGLPIGDVQISAVEVIEKMLRIKSK